MFDTEGSSVFPLSAQKTKIAIPKWMEGSRKFGEIH